MFGLLRKRARPSAAPEAEPRIPAPSRLELEGLPAFEVAGNVAIEDRFALLQWGAARAWVESVPEERRAEAWLACERAWLAHLRDSLGPEYGLAEGPTAMVVSTLEPRLARQMLEFMEKTLKRILRVLDGVAEEVPWGKDLLVVFDDADTYYRYVSLYHPDEGEYALSSGMHLGGECSHYVTTKQEVRSVEPVIAHEMTHGCLGHLPLPLWLNEGLAVNTEQRLAPSGASLETPQEMRAKHLRFWGAAEVQQFWSGESFRRQDDGNKLSYDLGRILVEQLSVDWHRFAAFVRSANYADGGNAAVAELYGTSLGSLAAAILEHDRPEEFEPRPETWRAAPHRTPARIHN